MLDARRGPKMVPQLVARDGAQPSQGIPDVGFVGRCSNKG